MRISAAQAGVEQAGAPAAALRRPTAARPAGWRARAAAVPRPLLALLLAATVLSIGWALLTTALQGPDEIGHAAYVQQLAETGDGPRVAAAPRHDRSTEMQALVRWQNLDALVGRDTARPGWSAAERVAFARAARDAARGDGGGPNALAQNPPLYYAYDAIAYDIGRGLSLPARLLLMRLAGLPLLWATIGATWLLLGELLPRRRFAQTVGTGAAALLPMLTFLSGVVNPDIALVAISTGAIALAVSALRLGPRPSVLLGLGGLGAAGVLVQGRGLALLPPLIGVLALVLWRARREGGAARRALLGLAALALMAAGVGAAVAYSRAHAGSTSFGGELTGSASSGLHDLRGLLDYVWQFYFSPLTDMRPPPGAGLFGYRQLYVEQFLVGAFGSLEVRYATSVYRVAQVAQGIGLLVLLGCVVRRWEVVRAHAAQALVLLAFVLSTLVLLHVAAWQDLSAPPHASLLTGRYLVPLVAVFAAAIAFVVDALPRRPGVALGAVVLAAGAALSVGGVALTLVRFHA